MKSVLPNGGAREEGRQEGLEVGRIEGERRFLLQQLERRVGELTTNEITLIEALIPQKLESLEEAAWGF